MRSLMTKSAFLLSIFAFASGAVAQEHAVTPLGESPPLWYEFRASVNDGGLIAWSQVVAASVEARLTNVPAGTQVDLHAIAKRDIAAGTIRSQAHELSNAGDVAGFVSSKTVEGDRQAVLWTPRAGGYVAVNLHASATEDYLMSAAYGVTEPQSGSVIAVGYERERISPTTLSQPVYWTVNRATGASSKAALPLSAATHNYGIAYSISEPDLPTRRFACGVALRAAASVPAQAGAHFTEAGCWTFTRNGQAWTPGEFTPIAETRVGADNAIATSVVNRVRTVDLGPVRGAQTLAVGYVVDLNGNVSGFVKNLTTGAYDNQFEIAPGAHSILSDVTSMVYALENRPAEDHAYGPVLVGVSSSVSGCVTSDGSTGTPCKPSSAPGPSTPIAVLRPAEQARMRAPGLSAEHAPVCNLQNEISIASPVTAAPQHISSVSRNGLWRVAIGDTQLYALQDTTAARHEFRVVVRDTIRYVTPSTSQSVRHYWADWSQAGASNLHIRWANSAGCQSVDANNVTCEHYTSGLANDGVAAGIPDVAASALPGLTRALGERPSRTYAYVSASATVGGDCRVTPVYLAREVEVLNPAVNFDANEDWRSCGAAGNATHGAIPGARIDVKSDARHCGDCNVNADDGRFCTVDTCAGGTASNVFDSSLGCQIGGTCYRFGDYEPYTDVQSPRLHENFCSQCQSSSPQAWTALHQGDPCCNSDGSPRDSRWVSARRPTSLPNIIYTNHENFSAATNAWITRIPSIADAHAWSRTGTVGRTPTTNASAACKLAGSGSNRRCELNTGYEGTCAIRGSRNNRYCTITNGFQITSGPTCNTTIGAQRGPRKLKSYLRSPAGSDDWYVFKMTDSTSYRNNPRVRVVPDNPSHDLALCMYAYCVDGAANRDFLSYNMPAFKRRVGTLRQLLTNLSAADMLVQASNPLRPDRVLFGACDGTQAGITGPGPRDLFIDMEMQNQDYGNDCWNIDFYVQVRRRNMEQAATPESGCWGYSLFWGNDRYWDTSSSSGHLEDDGNASLCDSATIDLETQPLN